MRYLITYELPEGRLRYTAEINAESETAAIKQFKQNNKEAIIISVNNAFPKDNDEEKRQRLKLLEILNKNYPD